MVDVLSDDRSHNGHDLGMGFMPRIRGQMWSWHNVLAKFNPATYRFVSSVSRLSPGDLYRPHLPRSLTWLLLLLTHCRNGQANSRCVSPTRRTPTRRQFKQRIIWMHVWPLYRTNSVGRSLLETVLPWRSKPTTISRSACHSIWPIMFSPFFF